MTLFGAHSCRMSTFGEKFYIVLLLIFPFLLEKTWRFLCIQLVCLLKNIKYLFSSFGMGVELPCEGLLPMGPLRLVLITQGVSWTSRKDCCPFTSHCEYQRLSPYPEKTLPEVLFSSCCLHHLCRTTDFLLTQSRGSCGWSRPGAQTTQLVSTLYGQVRWTYRLSDGFQWKYILHRQKLEGLQFTVVHCTFHCSYILFPTLQFAYVLKFTFMSFMYFNLTLRWFFNCG